MADQLRQHVCLVSAVVAVSGLMGVLDAQRRPQGQAAPPQAVTVSLKIGAQAYESREPGRCTHAPTAAIYSIVSEMWSVQQSGGRSLSLTLWKPKDGSAEMVTLAVGSGRESHEISTVRGGGTTSGSGAVRLEKSGKGGTFTIDAKTAAGAAISGTITCDGFAPHIAEGGL